MNPADVAGVWVNPKTGTTHAVIGYPRTGFRLACRPNTPTTLTDDDLLDYRYCGVGKCWNDACWRHFLNPEGDR